MTPSTAVERAKGTLPELAPTPALTGIDSGDISLPRLYKGEFQSQLVQDDVVPKGCIHVASGPDDPEPNVLWKLGEAEGVLAHVLDVRKGKSLKVGEDFTTWAFDDPDAPADANVDYHYVLALPEVDPDVPVKLTLSKTSVPAAKRINFLLVKNQGNPSYNLAFRLTTLLREGGSGGQKFKWFVWQARQVEADPANVAIAEKVSSLVAPANNDIERSAPAAEQPGI